MSTINQEDAIEMVHAFVVQWENNGGVLESGIYRELVLPIIAQLEAREAAITEALNALEGSFGMAAMRILESSRAPSACAAEA